MRLKAQYIYIYIYIYDFFLILSILTHTHGEKGYVLKETDSNIYPKWSNSWIHNTDFIILKSNIYAFYNTLISHNMHSLYYLKVKYFYHLMKVQIV